MDIFEDLNGAYEQDPDESSSDEQDADEQPEHVDLFVAFRTDVWQADGGSETLLRRMRRKWARLFAYLPPTTRESLAQIIKIWRRATQIERSAAKSVREAETYHELANDDFIGDYTLLSMEDYREALQVWLQAIQATVSASKGLQDAFDRDNDTADSRCDLYLGRRIAQCQKHQIKAQRALDALSPADLDAIARRKEARRLAQGNLGPGWVGSWPLGGGSFGAATLYVKQDPSGVVVDRLVVKDTLLAKTPSTWYRTDLWANDGGPDDDDSIPIEIQAMIDLRDKVGSESVVKLRNWKLSRENCSHRLYLEYCPHGDMFGLLTLEPYHKDSFKRRRNPSEVFPTAKMYPEPFLWYTFWTLATAGVLMEKGTLEQTGSSDWGVIVHRDFKPANVFLGPVSDTYFRCYPTPKLGDFGLATVIVPNDIRDPGSFQRAGTRATLAPEQVHVLRTEEGEIKPLSSKTNVFGIGITIWSMIQHREGFETVFTDWTNPKKRTLHPELDATVRALYSKDLLDLVESCVRYDDDDRPTTTELMDAIRHWTGEGPIDHAKGLRTADPTDKAWEDYILDTKFDKEQYTVGQPLIGNPPPEDRTDFPPPPSPSGMQAVDDLGGPAGMDYYLPRVREARPKVTLKLTNQARPTGTLRVMNPDLVDDDAAGDASEAKSGAGNPRRSSRLQARIGAARSRGSSPSPGKKQRLG